MTIGDKGNTFSVNGMDLKGSLQERKEPVVRKKMWDQIIGYRNLKEK